MIIHSDAMWVMFHQELELLVNVLKDNANYAQFSIYVLNAFLFCSDIGDRRSVFSDQNFPLEGDQSALGRSIVIFGPNYSGERFACANIEPDHDIVKYVNIQKPPKFVV